MITDHAPLDEERLLGPHARRSPDMDAVWTWVLAQDAGLPNWLDLPPAEARTLHDGLARRWNTTLPEVLSVTSLTVPGRPDMPCQLIEPQGAKPGCILFLHGGGWAFGNLDTHQRFMRLLAIAARCRVLGVDYRLAPEHPYPAPLDDARAAWRWLAERAATDPAFAGPLALAGDSAGANLAMGVLLDVIQTGARKADTALLFYGAYEAGADSPSSRRFAQGFGLTRAAMMRFWDFYAPNGIDRHDPRISALDAPDTLLRELPALYLNAAGLDPLLSDSLALVQRLERVAVRHRFTLHEGVHHGFMQMSLRLPEAVHAIEAAATFFREQIR